jgi:flagellar biosynthesis chaperone FliJ
MEAHNNPTQKVIEQMEEIKKQVKELSSKVESYNPKLNPEINWGHVGDLSHVLNTLKDLNNTILA